MGFISLVVFFPPVKVKYVGVSAEQATFLLMKIVGTKYVL